MPNLDHSLKEIPISYPIKVVMDGFEADTIRLQQNGWEISAHQAMDSFRAHVTVQQKARASRVIERSRSGWSSPIPSQIW